MNIGLKTEDMPPLITGRSKDLPVSPSPGTSDDGFEALLYPNRSLPNRGFMILMTIVIGVNVTLGLMFTMMGAWPVLAFGGLDILLVWGAFKISYRQGRLHERVRITSREMHISRVLPSGHEMRWCLQPFWTRIDIDEPIRHESQVKIISKGRTLILGSFLSPKERGEFAAALKKALHKATIS